MVSKLNSYRIYQNKNFFGRNREIEQLKKITQTNQANLIVVLGRRRIGKTELIEQFFSKNTVLKFEGIQTENRNFIENQQYQIDNCLKRLAEYTNNPLIAQIKCSSWSVFFKLLDEQIQNEPVVIYFEEIQWLAGYKGDFTGELKPFWDDKWRHYKNLNLILCGSSPSFIISQLRGDKALFSRATAEIHLKPFVASEIMEYFKRKGINELLLAILTVGGVIQYLKQLVTYSSIQSGLYEASFKQEGLFAQEAERIFVSSLNQNKYYKNIVAWLSKKRGATRNEIQNHFKISSGGTLTNILTDLEVCGFIEKITPLHLPADSLLSKYIVADEFLRFYYTFIAPKHKEIIRGRFNNNPHLALPLPKLMQYLGYSFERWCYHNVDAIARYLGFSAVEYSAGSFFSRKSDKLEKGFQIDLMFIRADHKILFGECKYNPTPLAIKKTYQELQQKAELFFSVNPKYKNYSYEFLLLTGETILDKSSVQKFFDHNICFEDLIH